MRKHRKLLIVVLALVTVILQACEKSTDESKNVADNNQSEISSTKNQNEEISNKGTTKEEANTIDNSSESKDDIQNNEEDTSINVVGTNNEATSKSGSSNDESMESKKQEYLQKLKDTKNKTEQLESLDTSTYALTKVENDRLKIWDDLLNEIYGVLEEQLPQDKMGILREKQLNWIKYRDESALKESQKYKGGTQENLEYVSVLANVTEERCYELVKDYMK